MPIVNGVMVSEAWANEMELVDSNRNTNIESNKLGLEAAKLANESAKIDNAAKKAALRNQAASSQMTNAFLSKWGDMNQKTLDVLTNTLSGAFSGDTPAGGIYGDLIGDIKNQITTFDQQYGGATKQLMDSTMQDVNTRRGLVTDLTGMAKADYAGVSGRAAADVGSQSEIARGDMAREAMSYGIDPTSGKFGALQKKSYLGEAKNKVAAMNRARMMEKDRSAGLTTTAINSIDPSVTGNLASDLMTQRGQMLELQTEAAKALSASEKAKADTALGVANIMGDIGSQYGSLGSTMLGLQTAQGSYGGGGSSTTSSALPGGTRRMSVSR